MKIEKLLVMITLILMIGFIGCNKRVEKVSVNYENEINNLETDEEKRKFLEKILADDQQVRDGKKEAELMLKYGKDSKQHMDYIEAQWQQDEIHLEKIETYLGKYGYPNKDELGKEAALAPWIVIHHSTDTEIRNRNFEILYLAYLTGDIDDTALSLYLGRTHEFKFQESFEIESPFQSEDKINQLIKKLDLEEKKANAQYRLQTARSTQNARS